tara:strand:- start:62 stop:304 length:243 start_codon:yes stop_codon:yes gene_type:complete
MEENKKENIRAFVDLNISGNARGGNFIESNLKDHVELLEEDGKLRVVGVVYDDSYNLEILTKPVEEIERDKQLNEKGIGK